MTLEEFYSLHNGKIVDFDGHYFGQCKDLFSFYNRDVVGNPAYVFGDAWMLYENCPASHYTKVNVPKKGDVAIWKREFGGYGHVAIVWDGNLFFSQNYPLKAPCSLQIIPTDKILGYLRPNNMNYENKVIRNEKDGSYAYVLKGEKREIKAERAGFAAITIIQRKSEVVNVPDSVYQAIPKGKDF